MLKLLRICSLIGPLRRGWNSSRTRKLNTEGTLQLMTTSIVSSFSILHSCIKGVFFWVVRNGNYQPLLTLLNQYIFPDWIFIIFNFCSLAKERLEPVKGLAKVVQWVKDHGYKRAAVTNAPRINSELMISLLGLTDFFQAVIVGGECEKPKPAPFPYLKALKELQVSADHTFIFEVNHFFICICCKLVIWFYLQLKNVCFCCRILLQAHVQALLLEFLLLLWQQGTQRSPYWMQEPRWSSRIMKTPSFGAHLKR